MHAVLSCRLPQPACYRDSSRTSLEYRYSNTHRCHLYTALAHISSPHFQTTEDEVIPEADEEHLKDVVVPEPVIPTTGFKRPPTSDNQQQSKRVRPDVAARRELNKTTEFSVVKTTRNTFCTEEAKALPWTTVLKEVNKTIAEAYILANIHIARVCEEGFPIPKLDQPFFCRCLSAASVGERSKSAAAENEQFMQSVMMYKSWRSPDCKPPNREQAGILKFPRNSKIEREPHLFIPLPYEFLTYFESRHPVTEYTKEAKQLRLLSLIPFKRGFDCSHLKMCNNGQHGLLKRGGLQVPPSGSQWLEEADSWWRKLFRIDRFKASNRKFAGEILTDGKTVSIVMRKPKKTVASRRIDLSDYSQVRGLDPGRKDTEFEKIKRWQDSHSDILEAIRNMPTKKTASVQKLKQYVESLLPRLDLLLDFHIRKDFRGLKFKRHVFAQKKLQLLCLKLTDRTSERTLVGFGDWSNRDQVGFIKKSPAGPVKRFENQLKRHCTAIAVDEYRTSKLHSVCHGELKHQYSKKLCRDGEVRVMKVHSVLHCTHNGCRDMTVNRDANASRNILLLLKCEIAGVNRPVAFRRSR